MSVTVCHVPAPLMLDVSVSFRKIFVFLGFASSKRLFGGPKKAFFGELAVHAHGMRPRSGGCFEWVQ